MSTWKTLPAAYAHCEEVYKAMEAEAITDEDGRLVYEGFTTKLFKKLGLAVPYYTAVMNHLKRMDCIRQISRGAASQPSRWALLQAPTPELYEASPGYKATTADQILGQQLRDQQKQINDLTTKVEILEAKVG